MWLVSIILTYCNYRTFLPSHMVLLDSMVYNLLSKNSTNNNMCVYLGEGALEVVLVENSLRPMQQM